MKSYRNASGCTAALAISLVLLPMKDKELKNEGGETETEIS
jgi:hypothetical protein